MTEPARSSTGFLALLTPEQQEEALAYRGSENMGDPDFPKRESVASAPFIIGAGTIYMGDQPIGRIMSAEPPAAERLVQIFPLEPVSISFKFKSVWWNPMWRQIISPPHAPKYRAPLRMCEARRFTPRRSYRR